MKKFLLPAMLVVFAMIYATQVATATTIYSDVQGIDVRFTGIQESSSFGDPEPLFGQPIGSGDQLLFFPPNFVAQAADGLSDQTGSQLQMFIEIKNAANEKQGTIDSVQIIEYGDVSLLGSGGTAATSATVSISGFVTVLEDVNGPITPQIIGFTGSYSPSLTGTFELPGDYGTQLWSGSFEVDVASVVPDATKVMLSFDNDLYAYSEQGTSSKIQKKVVDGPAVAVIPDVVIPEPTTFVLFITGLMCLVLSGRWR